MRLLIFASVFLLAMALMNVYIWRRFLRVLTHDIGHYLAAVPAILMVGDIFFVIDLITGIIPDSPTLYYITSAFIGMTFMLFVVSLIYDLTVTVSRRVPFDRDRRRAMKIGFDVTMLIIAFAYLLRGLSQGLRLPPVNTVRVSMAGFPQDQFSIVQLTDIHTGRTIKRGFIEYLVEQTNRLKPDIVVITGDLVDLPVHRIKQDLLPLKQLQAPAYFILGNHEYFHGPVAVADYMRELGIRPLLNEHVVVGEHGRHFNLVGLNDVSGATLEFLPPDTKQAYHGLDRDRHCIVLAHQPRMIEQMDSHRCDLMISGHTHGGQIFPFGLLVMAAQPYLAGLYQHAKGRQIFVSRGAGYWGPPLRVLAPNEISHIVIHAT